MINDIFDAAMKNAKKKKKYQVKIIWKFRFSFLQVWIKKIKNIGSIKIFKDYA